MGALDDLINNNILTIHELKKAKPLLRNQCDDKLDKIVKKEKEVKQMKNNCIQIITEINVNENYSSRLASYRNKFRCIQAVNEHDYKNGCKVISKNIINENKNGWELLRVQLKNQQINEEECRKVCEEAAANKIKVSQNVPETIVSKMIIAEYLMMYLEEN